MHKKTHHLASLENIVISCSKETLQGCLWVATVHVLDGWQAQHQIGYAQELILYKNVTAKKFE
jgi:hypothetical protein